MSKLATHYLPTHARPEDMSFIRTCNPYCAKIVYSSKPDPAHVQQVLDQLELSQATVVLRDHALSEQKDDVKRDPVATGQRHAAEWDETLRKLYDTTSLANAERVLVTGINEPPVWEEGVGIAPWVDYYAALMDAILQASVLALNLSVGWPANQGGDSPSDWKPYQSVIERCDTYDHWIGLHEYWGQSHGPDFYKGWWATRYRHLWIDYPGIPVLIGEYAPTQEFQHDSGDWGLDPVNGWKGSISEQNAYDQGLAYNAELSLDPYLTYATGFTLDGGHPWIEEYDFNPLIPPWTLAPAHWSPPAPIPAPIAPPTTPAPPSFPWKRPLLIGYAIGKSQSTDA